jgi:sugar phosphate permease
MKGQSAFAILCILMFGNGFLTGFLWPNLLPVIHSAFSPDEQSTILGFWATCPNFGNIIGFMIMQLIVFKNGLSWQLGMYIAASYMMLNAAYIGFRVD